MQKKKILKNEQETKEFAYAFAQKVIKQNNNNIVFLNGELGAGKTTFSQGFALGLGVTKQIKSPTFVFMRVYPLQNSLYKNFVHVDAYRLNTREDLESIGLIEYLNEQNIVLIEWSENIEKYIDLECIKIKLEYFEKDQRVIYV